MLDFSINAYLSQDIEELQDVEIIDTYNATKYHTSNLSDTSKIINQLIT
jgi:hypothetical protein